MHGSNSNDYIRHLKRDVTLVLMRVQTNLREILLRLLLGASLVACLIWLALCFLLLPFLMFVRGGRRKALGLHHRVQKLSFSAN